MRLLVLLLVSGGGAIGSAWALSRGGRTARLGALVGVLALIAVTAATLLLRIGRLTDTGQPVTGPFDAHLVVTSYLRLVVRSAMGGMPFDRTSGRFEATERLVELATQVAGSATPAERAVKPLDPRLVIACVVMLTLGWAATQSWVLPATGLADLEESEGIDGLEQVLLGILRDNLPGLG